MWAFNVVVLGFSLERPSPVASPAQADAARRLQDTPEVEFCFASCDDNHDADCDAKDSNGDYTRSCDQHPTTSCDEACFYPPSPALPPWPGRGTYPSPPPPSPEPNYSTFSIGVLVLILSLACLVTACLYADLRSTTEGSPTRRRMAYDWGCCVPCWRCLDRSQAPSPSLDDGEGSAALSASADTTLDGANRALELAFVESDRRLHMPNLRLKT